MSAGRVPLRARVRATEPRLLMNIRPTPEHSPLKRKRSLGARRSAQCRCERGKTDQKSSCRNRANPEMFSTSETEATPFSGVRSVGEDSSTCSTRSGSVSPTASSSSTDFVGSERLGCGDGTTRMAPSSMERPQPRARRRRKEEVGSEVPPRVVRQTVESACEQVSAWMICLAATEAKLTEEGREAKGGEDE